MRITVLGASGKTGREVVAAALARNLEVRSVWRAQPQRPLPGERVVVEPELLAAGALARACADADAVISAVGIRRRNPRNPWSRLISPPDLCERLAERLVAELGAADPPLYVLSAAGVADSRARMSPLLALLFEHSKVEIAYRDLARMEERLRASGRRCLVARPTTLTRGRSARWREVERFRLWSRISRRAVAECLIERALKRPPEAFEPQMISG